MKMTHGVAYDPKVWHDATPLAFAQFSWEEDAERFAALIRETERVSVVVVPL